MMFESIKKYLIMFLTSSSLVLGGTSFYYIRKTVQLKKELANSEIVQEIVQQNLETANIQLEFERRIRFAAEESVAALRGISDEVLSQELPAPVVSVINEFNSRMREQ